MPDNGVRMPNGEPTAADRRRAQTAAARAGRESAAAERAAAKREAENQRFAGDKWREDLIRATYRDSGA